MTCHLTVFVCACIALAAAEQPDTQRTEMVCKAIEQLAPEYDQDPYLVAAVAWKESRFDPTVTSGAGARGIMQVMPSHVLKPHGPFSDAGELHTIDGGVRAGLLTMVKFKAYAKSSVARRRGIRPSDWLKCYLVGVRCKPARGSTYIEQVAEHLRVLKQKRRRLEADRAHSRPIQR